jgi:AraC family transcriptional regulator
MILQTFPNLQWLKKQAEDRFSNRKAYDGSVLSQAGWPTVILNVKAGETFRDNIPGPFSFFSSLRGTSQVSADGKTTYIPQDYFFLSNAGQRYTLEIEKDKPAEIFNIHFGEKWAEESLAALTETTESLLDQPDYLRTTSIKFYNKLFVKDELVQSIQNQLLQGEANDSLREDELLFQLMHHLLDQHHQTQKQIFSIPAVKAATREEILKRLFIATVISMLFIIANYHWRNFHPSVACRSFIFSACSKKSLIKHRISSLLT